MTLVLSGPDYPHRALANDAATTANDAGIFGGRDEQVVLAPGKTARIRRSDRRNGISRLSPRRHREYVSLDFDGWKTLCVAPLHMCDLRVAHVVSVESTLSPQPRTGRTS